MKSPSFLGTPFSDVNRLFKLEFSASFRRLFFSCCSARTLAVEEAVPACLIRPLGVDVPLTAVDPFAEFASFGIFESSLAGLGASAGVSIFFFLFFPEPGAFLSECVRP